MSVISIEAGEMHCKILYCGPERSGKKSSLLQIKDRMEPSAVSFFTLPFKKKILCLSLSAGKVWGLSAFFHICNLSNESREDNKKLLTGTDGIVFTASSAIQDRGKNKDAFAEMESLLKETGKNPFKIPLVLQYNKKDPANSLSLLELRRDLNKYNSRDFSGSVLKGEAVIEPLKHVCKLALNRVKTGH